MGRPHRRPAYTTSLLRLESVSEVPHAFRFSVSSYDPGVNDVGPCRRFLCDQTGPGHCRGCDWAGELDGRSVVVLMGICAAVRARFGRLRDPVCTTAFGAARALECAYLAGAKIAEQSRSRIKERDPRKTGLFFANTATVKSSERRSRPRRVESARFQTKCSCEARSVNE